MARRAPRAAHARRRHETPSEEHLRELGGQIPPLPPEVAREVTRERRRRMVPWLLAALVVVLVVVFLALQWTRPLPAPAFDSTLGPSVALPGGPPSLPWPSGGSAALSVAGGGSLGTSGSAAPAPVASIAKVLTAYVVLAHHPLAPGATGPAIAVSADVVGAYELGIAAGQSEVAVETGESLTEQQALEGLLVGGANDMATLLANWDAGSTSAFVAEMNASARTLGLGATHVTDPSGLDPGTVSSPADLVRLGEAAMAVPALAQIVGMRQVTLPLAGTVDNLDTDLGTDGFVGIKTGSDSAAGDCFLFEATRSVDQRTVRLVGVVLGQPSGTALASADALTQAAFAAATVEPVLPKGGVVGRLTAPWGASVNVVTSGAASVVAWSGQHVAASVHLSAPPATVRAGTPVGTLELSVAGQQVTVGLQTSAALAGPPASWRLLRH